MYKRILLKLSGEALSSPDNPIDLKIISELCDEIAEAVALGIEIAIVVGGGNFIRGKVVSGEVIERVQADYMGMIATVMNGIAIQGSLERKGIATRLQSAIEMNKVAEPLIVRRANRHLEKGRVVIFAAGTGSPFFSTDTTAALRASEIDADIILMAKNGVDGVYDKDPRKYNDAKKFEELTYKDLLSYDLEVMDSTAASLCKETNKNVIVFNMNKVGNILKIIQGEKVGTLLTKGGN